MSEIDRRWIVANVIAAAVLAAAGLLDYAAREWLEAGDAETPFGITITYAVASAAVVGVGCAIYAWFIGAVLRQILPALPLRSWLVLHLAIGIVVGFGLALTYSAPTGEPDNWSDAGFLEGTLLVLVFLAALALLGAAFGSLQAIVLRRAAEGMRNWIAISALAEAVMVLPTIPVLLFYPANGTFVREIATEGVLFVGTVAGSFVMLLALRRLRPRTA